MTQDDDAGKVARFEVALGQLIARIAEDRYLLAVVLVGSLSTETIWRRESLGLWIIEADGVSRRLLRSIHRSSMAVAILSLAAVAIFFVASGLDIHLFGITQRLVATFALLWQLLAAFGLLGHARRLPFGLRDLCR